MPRPLRPMLAVEAPRLTWGPDGFWVQPKFDGLRCLIDPTAGPVLRSGGAVHNPRVREVLSDPALAGLDGELTAPGGLEAAQSAFTSNRPPPAGWTFTAFDDASSPALAFAERLQRLRQRLAHLPAHVRAHVRPSPAQLASREVDAQGAFAAVITAMQAEGTPRALDGLILRRSGAAYHEGKASAFRGELIKLKPMSEGECPVLDLSARPDAPDCLGAVQVRHGGATVWAPAGMPRADARRLWRERDSVIGKSAVIRWWGTTARGLPRHAVAVALRRDLAA